MADAQDLIASDAAAIVELLRQGEIQPHDLLDALEQRITAVDQAVNALPTLCFERARAHADRLMRQPPAERGPLCGLPVPIKDLIDVAGVRSTRGSPIYADHVPAHSDLLVEHLEANGGIIYAMSNTPEFGAGANTFNPVFGATLNPWNTRLSVAVLRRSRGGACDRHGLGCARLRYGRLVAQSGKLLWCGGLAAK